MIFRAFYVFFTLCEFFFLRSMRYGVCSSAPIVWLSCDIPIPREAQSHLSRTVLQFYKDKLSITHTHKTHVHTQTRTPLNGYIHTYTYMHSYCRHERTHARTRTKEGVCEQRLRSTRRRKHARLLRLTKLKPLPIPPGAEGSDAASESARSGDVRSDNSVSVGDGWGEGWGGG